MEDFEIMTDSSAVRHVNLREVPLSEYQYQKTFYAYFAKSGRKAAAPA